MIHSFKYKNRVSLGVILSELMYEFIKAEGDVTKGVDVITAVPLGAWRRRQRGFNQAALLAANISKRTAISFGDILRKRRHTAYQNELSRDKRLTNLSGAFAVREGAAIGGLGILLIDDVMTTGATLEECSAVLLSAGAKAVTCLTLARGA
jgi:ComF family protein